MVNKTKLLFTITKREIKSNIKQFLAIIFIVSLAVTLFVGLSANTKSFNNRVNKLYKEGNIADIYTYVSSYDGDDLFNLKNIDNVEDVNQRFVMDGELNGGAITFILNEKEPTIAKPSSYDGTSIDCLIDSYFARLHKINVGDSITFHLPLDLTILTDNFKLGLKNGVNDPFDNGMIPLSFNVTGTMTHPEAIENGAFSTGKMMVSQSYYETAFNKLIDDSYVEAFASTIKNTINSNVKLVNQYVLTVDQDKNIDSVLNGINEYYSNKESSNLVTALKLERLPSNATIQSDLIQAEQLAIVFPAIFFLVAILVVLTSITQMIFKSRQEIGTFKALGFNNKELTIHYIGIGITLCLIGVIIGSFLGPFLIPFVMNQKYKLIYNLPVLNYTLPVASILQCVAIFIVLAAIVTFIVVRSEIKLKPSESMRPRVIANFKEQNNDKKVKPNHALLALKMAFRNIINKKSRTMMVLLGVMGCTALLCAGFGVMDTINYGMNLDMDINLNSDITLTYNETGHSLKQELLNDPDIIAINEYSESPIRILTEDKAFDTTIKVFEDDSTAYQFLEKIDNGLILPYKIASELSISKGEEISYLYMGTEYKTVVDDIFETSLNINAFSFANNVQGIPVSGAHLFVKDDAKLSDVKTRISEQYSISNLTTKEDTKKQADNILSSIKIMTNTVKVFAILLAIVVSYNLALLNFNEQKRDIATLKVLGFKKIEIGLSLVFELLFLTIIGAILGLFLGYPLLVLILEVNKTSLIYYLYHINFSTYIYSILISLGTALVVNFLLVRVANKVNSVEALKSVE